MAALTGAIESKETMAEMSTVLGSNATVTTKVNTEEAVEEYEATCPLGHWCCAKQTGQANGSGTHPLQSPCCKAEAISTGATIECNTRIIFALSVEPEGHRHLDNP